MTGPRAPEPTASDAAWATHGEALDRLAAHRRRAEAEGWTSCALEREGAAGAFALFGVPPGGTLRSRIAQAADAVAPSPEVAIAARALRRCAAALAATEEGPGERASDGRRPPETSGASSALVPPHGPPPGSPDGSARERLARPGERETWRAQDAARDALVAAVAVYTRLLREEGHSAQRTVTAVAVAVRAGAASVSAPAALALLVHEAGSHGVECYYTP